jgi:hypothetical protein
MVARQGEDQRVTIQSCALHLVGHSLSDFVRLQRVQIRVVDAGCWGSALGERGRRRKNRVAVRRGGEQARRRSGGVVGGPQLQRGDGRNMRQQRRLRGPMEMRIMTMVVFRTVRDMRNQGWRRGPALMMRALRLLRGLHSEHDAIEREREVVEICFDMLRKANDGLARRAFRTREPNRGLLQHCGRSQCAAAGSVRWRGIAARKRKM